MNLVKAENGEIVIRMPVAEASDALYTLRNRADELDDCEDLTEALEAAGVPMPEEEDHRRYEYMPPVD
ncbi:MULTISPECIES: hypothetical protein [unclassified Thioalkalivibrio]|uniref:hypothetical protein n=1 Tax=unclassified Thioalkalivibrio TaxID=2621013 RepID=UPI0003A00F7A|nr:MULTISPECIES: hypothetical protein [unclassified Thioalkalivibrio]